MLVNHIFAVFALAGSLVFAYPRPATLIPRASPSDNEFYKPILIEREAEPERVDKIEVVTNGWPSVRGRFAHRLNRRFNPSRVRREPSAPWDVPRSALAEAPTEIVISPANANVIIEEQRSELREEVAEIEDMARLAEEKEEMRHAQNVEAIERRKEELIEEIVRKNEMTEEALSLAKRLIEEELERVKSKKARNDL